MSHHLRHGRPHRVRGWALVRSRAARLAQRRYMRLVHYQLSVYDGPCDQRDLLVLHCTLHPSAVVSAVARRREIVVRLPADKLVLVLRTDREFHVWRVALADAARNFAAFYTLVPAKHLGTGAFSSVFFAFDNADGHHVAVKLVDKTLCSRPELALAHTEARVMAFVSHPCIVQCLDVFDSPDTLHIVMSYMSNSTLDARILAAPPAKRPLPESVAATIMSRLLHALAYLHREHIVHRDVKPDNILLAAHPNDNLWATTARLADFGLAAFVDHDLTDIVGTPNYLAPEIISRHPDDNQRLGYGPPVDLWAAGVTMFWLLSGALLPFDAPDPATVLKNIRTSQLTLAAHPWNRVSDHAKSLLRALLHPNPHTRLTAPAACAHPWLRHSQHLLPLTDRTLAYRRVGRLSPADRWRVAILAVRAFLNLRACTHHHRLRHMSTMRRSQLQRAADKRRHAARRQPDPNEKAAPERAPTGADALGYNVGFIPSFAPKRRARAPPPDRTAKLRTSKSLSLEKRVLARLSADRDSIASDRSSSTPASTCTSTCTSTSSTAPTATARSADGDSVKSDGSEAGSSSSTKSSLRTFRLASRGVKKISRLGAPTRHEPDHPRMSSDASRPASHVL